MNRSSVFVRSIALLATMGALAPLSQARTLEILGYTAELRLAHVELPVTQTGIVTFRSCGTCDPYSLQVTPSTLYVGFDGPLTLEEFKAAVTQIRLTQNGNQTTGVGVSYDAESHLVTAISLHENTFRSAAQ